jgi:hypothetical protein
MPVSHACNPSYSGGRDQEDHGLKPAQAIFKKPFRKRAGGVAKMYDLSSSPGTAKKKKTR